MHRCKQNLKGSRQEQEETAKSSERREYASRTESSKISSLQKEMATLTEKTADFEGLFERYTTLRDDYDSLEGAHQSISQNLQEAQARQEELQKELLEQEQAVKP